jgi:hypothetical protein
VQYLLAWTLRRRGADIRSWFGAAADELLEEVRNQSIVDAIRNEEVARVIVALAAVDGAMPALSRALHSHSHYPDRCGLVSIPTSPVRDEPAGRSSLRLLGYEQATSTRRIGQLSGPFERSDNFDIAHYLDVH